MHVWMHVVGDLDLCSNAFKGPQCTPLNLPISLITWGHLYISLHLLCIDIYALLVETPSPTPTPNPGARSMPPSLAGDLLSLTQP
jgi:hypothetical protein